MIKTLKECYENQKVASFYFNKEDNCAHLTGFLHCYNENEILIAHITPRGEYDGFVLSKIDNLYRVDYSGDYEKKIQLLYKLKSQSHSTVTCDKDSILFSFLEFANKNKYLISMELENASVTGFVEEYDDSIRLKVINENGVENGGCVINIDEVITFSCDTDYEQDLKILNSVKEQF